MENEKISEWLQVAKAVALASALSLVLALAFAGALRTTSLSDKTILPVNLAIKAVSVFVGCAFCLRGEKGWLRGGIAGLLFVFVSGLLFSLVGGGFAFSWLLLLEVAFGFVAGALSGIFAVNIRGN